MAARLMGVETEFAAGAMAPDGAAIACNNYVGALIHHATAAHATLPGAGGGVFLANGARLYVDCGSHPEFCTPECSDPWEVVRYVLAGERILLNLARLVEADTGLSLNLYKCNVDYSGAHTTWGCHESYLHRADPSELSAKIIPHLVSRIIYTGAGGFDSLSPGLEFTLSPRAPHMTCEVSGSSTYDRGIFHTKDESLAQAGYHRLHLICGESLSSETAMWLKAGTTALVVAMAEQGIDLGCSVALRKPLEALRAFAADPKGRVKAEVGRGLLKSALSIQRHYLARADIHAKDSFMPPWAGEVCRLWRETLEGVEAGPRAVSKTLDWAIKLALYRNYAARKGFSWESLSAWTHVQRTLHGALCTAGYNNHAVTVEFLRSLRSPVRHAVRELDSYLREKGLSWDRLGEFLRLRQELFELDTKFGQLGPRGLFAQLDQAGVLEHKVEGVGDIEEAERTPPPTGRARLRGEFIKRAVINGRAHYTCDWSSVWDNRSDGILDLSDPFIEQAQWSMTSSFENAGSELHEGMFY